MLFRTGDPNFMTSLARGLEVLRGFSGAPRGLKMAELSRITGLSRAVVRRCLHTLQAMGYVRTDRDVFLLEPKILALGHSYFSSNSLPGTAQPFLEGVSHETQESCSLAVLDQDEVVYVARSATRRIMAVSLNLGSRLPAGCTSLGRVLLAQLSSAELEAYLARVKLVKLTEHTLTTKRDLAAAIESARTQGFAIVSEELEIGLRSIAVPVFSAQGTAVAAMNVSVQAARVSAAELKSRVLPLLKRAAADLGSRLTG